MNNKSKKVKQQQNNLEKIVYFPNKLNILSIFLIFILYGTVLFVSVSAVFPDRSYQDIPDYSLSTHNDEINPYALLIGSSVKESEDSNKYITNTKLYSYVRPMYGSKVRIIKFAYSGLDSNGLVRYYIENARRNDNKLYTSNTYYTDISGHTYSKEVSLKNSSLDKLFMKVRYRITVDEVEEIKTLKLSENTLKLTKDELSKYGFGSYNDLVIVNLKIENSTSDNTEHKSELSITVNDKTKPYHINYQSWIVTDDNQILPYIGLYNFRHSSNFEQKNIHTKKVANASWVYSRLVYTDGETGEVSELFFKTEIEK
ncbi:MAG: hypothetical protein WC006_07865 [Bacilli bacterium]|nr:hypothetical protein [Bacilli bacterium]